VSSSPGFIAVNLLRVVANGENDVRQCTRATSVNANVALLVIMQFGAEASRQFPSNGVP